MQKLMLAVGLAACLFGGLAQAASPDGDRLINAAHPGEVFDYKTALVPGHVNIVDFYSQFCPPCRKVMPMLEKLTRMDPHYVVLRLDVNRPDIRGIDFESPLAQQYRLQALPAFKIHDAHGKLLAEGDKATDQVISILESHHVH